MPDYPSGTVAFLFTDIEGSTRRWETQQQVMWTAVQRHFTLLGDAIAANDGVLFKTIGDAVQAAFPTVPAAVAAAIEAQAALRDEDWGELGPLRVRMAIHVGEATPRNGDYLAPVLNRLARALSTGYGDQILLTEAARALAATLPGGHSLRDLGRHRLRDLLEAEHIFQLVGPGLPVDFPPLKSLDQQPNNLPAQPTALIGRDEEVAALRLAITNPDTSLLTLTGPGGTGKTRLALQVAAESLDAFADGVWFVPLAAIADPSLVLDAIATALNVREVAGEPLSTTLTEHLKARHALILLDNMEQVLAASQQVAELLQAAPQLDLLVTSREPLRLRAEREIPVAPLALPEDETETEGAVVPEVALLASAVRLFVERAQGVKPSFTLNAENVADVVAICRRLDGLPLAIELAAARVRVLSPAALLARLDQRLSILTGGARDLPQRQQTLRAAIAWSHDLLDVAERALFARLAIFTGGCTFEAAEAICEAAGGIALDPFDGIDSLVQKSLLRREEGPADDARFAMLETIREFARERLDELPEADDLRQAHADIFLALADCADWDDLANQATLLDRLEADHANLRQAIAYYETQGEFGAPARVRMAASLAHFWWVRGHLSEGRRFLESVIVLDGDVPPADRAHALFGAALLAESQWDVDRARELHEEALALRRQAGDARGIARSLTGLGEIARNDGDLDAARALHQEALDVWKAIGDRAGAAGAQLDLGIVSCLRGDNANAGPILEASLSRFTELGDLAGEAAAHQWLGILSSTKSDIFDAAEHFTESLGRWRALDNQQMIANDLANLGEARIVGGSVDEAELLLRESMAICERLGDPIGKATAQTQLARVALVRGESGAAIDLLRDALRESWDAGNRALTTDILDALAEGFVARHDLVTAAQLLDASDQIRIESGIKRAAVYRGRYFATREAVHDVDHPDCLDIGATIEHFLSTSLASNVLADGSSGPRN